MTILELLILRIKAVVNSNGTQAIRGDNLQNTLVDIAQTTDRHFAYKNGDPNEEFAAKAVITGEVRSENYTGGAFGAGYQICTDAVTGESTAIFHNIVAKNGITAPMFTVRMMAATGGIDVTSAANAKLTNVVDGGSYWQCFYKCAGQLWKPLDQARIQSEFGGFLWGLVTAVSEQPNDRGEYSFNISKTTVASGSNATPKLDDVVVLYGHRGADRYRQSLFIKSCGVDNPDEDYEPYEAKYVAINSFSLPKSKCTKWDGLTFDIAVNSFTIIGRDGNLYQQPNDRGGHVSGTTYYAFDRVSRDGSVWQCVADSTTTTPSDGVSDWVCVVPKGTKGDYSVQGYQWAEDKPQRPVGSSPEGWSAGSDRGVAIVDGSSANNSASSSANDSTEAEAETNHLLTDESGVVLLEPYPASYRLWGSTATFDGATGEVVGEWSDPYQVSAEDGKDGQDGNSTNLLSRLSANWRRGVNLGDDGTYRDWDGYICPRKALEVKGGVTYTLQRLSDNQLFSIVILLYDQSDAYLGAAAVRVAYQGNLVFQTPPAAKFARFNFGSNPEGGTHYVSLLAELATSQVGLYQGEVTQWSPAPAPEDVQVEVEAAKAEALKLRPFQGEFNANTVYFNNSSRQDIVRYGEMWYSYIGVDGVAASWSAANWKSYLFNSESVATELLLAEEANIANFLFRGGNLTSQTLDGNGEPNLSLDGVNGIVKATKGNFGAAYFDSDGTLTIRKAPVKKASGEIVLGEVISTFTRGDVNPLSELLAGNEVGSNPLTGFSASGSASDTSRVSVTLEGSITTSKANTDVTVSGVELVARMSGTSQDVYASATAELFNDKGEVFSLGSVMASSLFRVSRKTIEFTGKMATAGTYRVRVIYSLSKSANVSWGSIFVSDGTISKLFIKAANESQLGRGLAVIFDSLNYFYYGNNPANNNRKELIYKGYSDLPGTLLWAGYDTLLGVHFYEGAKKHATLNISKFAAGSYRIYHSIGHTGYAINVGIESTSLCGWYYKNQTTTSVEIVICNTGGTPTDKNFTVTLTGKN